MEKIKYPPYIEGILPAFQKDKNNSNIVISVPFSHNPAIGFNDYKGFCLRIRYAYNDSKIDEKLEDIFSDNYTDSIVTFTIPISNKLKIGQFYKLQIAYADENNKAGVYSTVGVAKFAQAGPAAIQGFQSGSINQNFKIFRGFYTVPDEDIYEKEYSYQFSLYNINNELLYTSGELMHNNNLDYDEWYFNRDLEESKTFLLVYKIKTLNGLSVSSDIYKVVENQLLTSNYTITIIPELDYENGCINIKLSTPENIFGQFSISRASEDSEYKEWLELKRFILPLEDNNEIIFTDFLIEQGKSYKYSIQQRNSSGLLSKRYTSDAIKSDFEHMFLYDGNRQLKIKYNPKVSTFKDTVLESKTDTIGGTYPYIFRNKVVQYKEFALSGLLSYLSDEKNLFTKSISKGYYDEKIEKFIDTTTTNLTSDNIFNERQYKLEVLSWLNNGEIKILKTPTEGNYIVRLMNCLLSPTDSLGRMLHTFSATAYEMANYTINNLNDYGFIYIDKFTNTIQYAEQFGSIDMNAYVGKDIDEQGIDLINSKQNVTYIQITGAQPGTRFLINSDHPIMIGSTGHYEIIYPSGINSIKLLPRNDKTYTGVLTYNYQIELVNDFDKIVSYHLQEITAVTVYGNKYMPFTSEMQVPGMININSDIIKDKTIQFNDWRFLQIRKRPIVDLMYDDYVVKNLYDKNKDINLIGYYQDYFIYETPNNSYLKLYCLTNNNELVERYYQMNKLDETAYQFIIGKNSGNLQYGDKDEMISFDSPSGLGEVQIGIGLTADIGYRYLKKTYKDQSDFEALNTAKANYDENPTFLNWMIYQRYYNEYLETIVDSSDNGGETE